ncbi:sperm flagellar protein 1-like [Antennarius striatus]|uniref:sperm flagellar protein 1-like n=1 Tax=Antennarius striatus TaxID=241820 RepID=UPI0035ADE43F
MEQRRKELIDLYVWLDQIPLSRPRRNITRDFSDGVMAAEVTTDRPMSKEELEDLHKWFNKIPLSQPIKNITRDFSDGVMAAEVVKHFFPKLVDLYNYTPTNSVSQKRSNWDYLNRKVFCKLAFCVSQESVNRIAMNTVGAIVPILVTLKTKVQKKLEQSAAIKQNLRNVNTKNERSPQREISQVEKHSAQPGEEMKKYKHRSIQNFGLDKPEIQTYKDVPPNVRTVLCQKDEEILQLRNKVIHLEFMCQLKGEHIEILKNPSKKNTAVVPSNHFQGRH